MDVGYSGTPLPKKLGIKEDSVVLLYNPPHDLAERLQTRNEGEAADVVVLFTPWQAELISLLPEAIAKLKDRGGLWIAWPKKASKVPTDIVEQTLRDLILPTGFVDNKVCAIDQTWSGLRFVRRLNAAK
jgi:hypothetical protein